MFTGKVKWYDFDANRGYIVADASPSMPSLLFDVSVAVPGLYHPMTPVRFNVISVLGRLCAVNVMPVKGK